MDAEVLDMIDSIADELFLMLDAGDGSISKQKLVDYLENRFQWVINYTHGADAILDK